MKIIFAQGNPGREYASSRHNTGFLALDSLGDKHNALWKDVDKFKARIAELTLEKEKVLLVKPSSFYNDTGAIARKLIDFYKVDPAADLLVIHDDLALPFGTVRVRERGGDAGNNGIKSLNLHLGEEYRRIRVGVWTDQRDMMDDIAFVLGNFKKEELHALEKHILPHVSELVESFLKGTFEITSAKIIE